MVPPLLLSKQKKRFSFSSSTTNTCTSSSAGMAQPLSTTTPTTSTTGPSSPPGTVSTHTMRPRRIHLDKPLLVLRPTDLELLQTCPNGGFTTTLNGDIFVCRDKPLPPQPAASSRSPRPPSRSLHHSPIPVFPTSTSASASPVTPDLSMIAPPNTPPPCCLPPPTPPTSSQQPARRGRPRKYPLPSTSASASAVVVDNDRAAPALLSTSTPPSAIAASAPDVSPSASPSISAAEVEMEEIVDRSALLLESAPPPSHHFPVQDSDVKLIVESCKNDKMESLPNTGTASRSNVGAVQPQVKSNAEDQPIATRLRNRHKVAQSTTAEFAPPATPSKSSSSSSSSRNGAASIPCTTPQQPISPRSAFPTPRKSAPISPVLRSSGSASLAPASHVHGVLYSKDELKMLLEEGDMFSVKETQDEEMEELCAVPKPGHKLEIHVPSYRIIRDQSPIQRRSRGRPSKSAPHFPVVPAFRRPPKYITHCSPAQDLACGHDIESDDEEWLSEYNASKAVPISDIDFERLYSILNIASRHQAGCISVDVVSQLATESNLHFDVNVIADVLSYYVHKNKDVMSVLNAERERIQMLEHHFAVMTVLRRDFEKVRILMELVRKRERFKRYVTQCQMQYVEQQFQELDAETSHSPPSSQLNVASLPSSSSVSSPSSSSDIADLSLDRNSDGAVNGGPQPASVPALRCVNKPTRIRKRKRFLDESSDEESVHDNVSKRKASRRQSPISRALELLHNSSAVPSQRLPSPPLSHSIYSAPKTIAPSASLNDGVKLIQESGIVQPGAVSSSASSSAPAITSGTATPCSLSPLSTTTNSAHSNIPSPTPTQSNPALSLTLPALQTLPSDCNHSRTSLSHSEQHTSVSSVEEQEKEPPPHVSTALTTQISSQQSSVCSDASSPSRISSQHRSCDVVSPLH